DRAYRTGGLGTQAVQINFTVLARAAELFINQLVQLPRMFVQFAQPGLEGQITPLRGALKQHLAVTNDVIQRRVQLVPQMIQGGAIGGHAPGPRLSKVSIFPSSRGKSIGLMSKSSQPTDRAFSWSPGVA